MAASESALAVGGYVRSSDAKGLADLKARLTKHPLFVGTLIDAEARTTATPTTPASPDVRLRSSCQYPAHPTLSYWQQRPSSSA